MLYEFFVGLFLAMRLIVVSATVGCRTMPYTLKCALHETALIYTARLHYQEVARLGVPVFLCLSVCCSLSSLAADMVLVTIW